MSRRGTIPRAASRNSRRAVSRAIPDERGTVAARRCACARAETAGLPYAVDETKPARSTPPWRMQRRTKLDPFAIAAIRLLMLTGARLREILHAKWEYVDFERGVMFLPDSKTGKKPIYLSAAALAILAGLPRIEGNPFIIAGARTAAPRADLKKPWAAVDQGGGP